MIPIAKVLPKAHFRRARLEAQRIAASLDAFPADPFVFLKRHPHVCDVCFDDLPPMMDAAVLPLLPLAKEGGAGAFVLVVFNNLYLGYPPNHFVTRRLRWSAAHELGHIVLNHIVRFPRYVLCDNAPDEERAAELEANTFAEELLMPTPVFVTVQHLSVEELMDYFGVNRDPVLRRIASFESYLRAVGSSFRSVWFPEIVPVSALGAEERGCGPSRPASTYESGWNDTVPDDTSGDGCNIEFSSKVEPDPIAEWFEKQCVTEKEYAMTDPDEDWDFEPDDEPPPEELDPDFGMNFEVDNEDGDDEEANALLAAKPTFGGPAPNLVPCQDPDTESDDCVLF